MGEDLHLRAVGHARHTPSRRPLARPPQDEELFLMSSKAYLILRSARQGASRRTQDGDAALRLNSCPASQRIPPLRSGAVLAGQQRVHLGSAARYSGKGWLAAKNRLSWRSAGSFGSSMPAEIATKAATGSRASSTARARSNLVSMSPTEIWPSTT